MFVVRHQPNISLRTERNVLAEHEL